jgi:hypothetical protein
MKAEVANNTSPVAKLFFLFHKYTSENSGLLNEKLPEQLLRQLPCSTERLSTQPQRVSPIALHGVTVR